MDLEVMSRRDFEKYSQQNHKITSIVVSISSVGEHRPTIADNPDNGILGVLSLNFNDTANPDPSAYGICWVQALQIAQFIKHSKDMADKIIVHCGAGQSRSAGVAAAILKYYTGDDTPIYNNPRYTPNNLCYRNVLEALMMT